MRRPSRSRLHPIALIESEEAIQASLMEVINGLLRNTLDVKRAELILRALHIAVKNARRTKFDAFDPMRDIPEYAAPPAKAVPDAETEVPEPELDMPYTAAIPLQPSREERAEREHQAKLELERARQATIRAQLGRAGKTVTNSDSSPISHPKPTPAQTPLQPSQSSKGGNTAVDPTKPKPPVSVKTRAVTAESKTAPAPLKERKNADQRASAG